MSCEANPKRTADIPTLAQMTSKAIELLKDNPNGFFLQVEGASIDKQDHAANPCGQIGETVDLDEAVQKALAFAKADGETLVIVTADHAHSSQIIPPETAAPGLTQLLTTGRRAAGDQLRQLRGRLPGAHRHPVAHRRLRPAGRQCHRPDRPDRPVLHHPSRTEPARLIGPERKGAPVSTGAPFHFARHPWN